MTATPQQQAVRIPAAKLPPIELVDRILSVSEDLTNVIQLETEWLKTGKSLSIGELQEQKTKLANDYTLDIQAILHRKELVDRAPAERVGRLKSSMARLDQALAANKTALDASRSVSEGILKAVAAHVSASKSPVQGYGRNASISQSGTPAAAIALDARF